MDGYSDDPIDNIDLLDDGKAFPWFVIKREIAVSGKIMGMELSRFRTWLWLLAKTNNRGLLPVDLHDLTEWPFLPNFSYEQMIDDIEYLVNRRLIDRLPDGRLKMHNFEKHQPQGMVAASNKAEEKEHKTRSANAERQKRHREREKARKLQQQAGRTPAAGTEPQDDFPRPEGVSSQHVEPERDNGALHNAFRNDQRNDERNELSNATVTPYREVDKIQKQIRKQQQQQAADAAARPTAAFSGEWIECWKHLLEIYPEGKVGQIPNALQAFQSVIGREAPSPDGLNLKESGIPTPEYYWSVVAPAVEQAKSSQQWAPRRGTQERPIPNLTTFLTGNRDPEKPIFGRMWITQWEPSIESKAMARAVRTQNQDEEIPVEHLRKVLRRAS